MRSLNLVSVLLALNASAAIDAAAAVGPTPTQTNTYSIALDRTLDRSAAAEPQGLGAVTPAASYPRDLRHDGFRGDHRIDALPVEQESLPSGWLMALLALGLVGHQLRRKHRLLRPHRFTFWPSSGA